MTTKKEALNLFGVIHGMKLNRDPVAKREAWNNFIDKLCEGGEVTPKQRDSWVNPF